jgi:hypothetical protein
MRTYVLAFGVSVSTLALVLGACGGDDTGNQANGDGGGDGSMMSEGSVDTGSEAANEAGMDAPSEGATDTGTDAPAGASFCDGTIGAIVSAFESCCSAADMTTQDYMLIDSVLQAFKMGCETQLQGSVNDGRVTLDSTAAGQCEQALQGFVMGGFCWNNLNDNKQGGPLFGTAPCNGVVTGTVNMGQACAADYECKDGLTCVGWTNGSDGMCQTPGGAGSACGHAADAGSVTTVDYGFGNHPACASGNYCNGTTCATQGASGAMCNADVECTAGLSCHLHTCGNSPQAPVNGACADKYDCQAGLYCASTDGGAAGTCQMREASGGSCTSTGDQCKGYCTLSDGGMTGSCAAICGSG